MKLVSFCPGVKPGSVSSLYRLDQASEGRGRRERRVNLLSLYYAEAVYGWTPVENLRFSIQKSDGLSMSLHIKYVLWVLFGLLGFQYYP